MNHINITVAGLAASGKTAIMVAIAQALKGYDLEVEVEDQEPIPKDFDHYPRIRELIKRGTVVKIEAKQLPQTDEKAFGGTSPWTLFWRDGKRQVVHGSSFPDAMNKAGYGQGALAALDFYSRGDDHSWEWNKETRNWEPQKVEKAESDEYQKEAEELWPEGSEEGFGKKQ